MNYYSEMPNNILIFVTVIENIFLYLEERLLTKNC